MICLSMRLGALAFCGAFACFTCSGQNPASAAAQSASTASAATTPQTSDASLAASANGKNPKKVWTNDDVSGLNGPVSVVGNAKNPGKGSAGRKADPQYIANTRKELEKLQSQLDDTDKQLVDLQDFTAGKAAATSGGYQINKGYNREPVDQQITGLQEKKKELQDKIGALLDEARKKGVQPGDLR
jgi:hypothetical protein